MDPLDCPTGFAVQSFEVQYIVLAYAIGKTYRWGRIYAPAWTVTKLGPRLTMLEMASWPQGFGAQMGRDQPWLSKQAFPEELARNAWHCGVAYD